MNNKIYYERPKHLQNSTNTAKNNANRSVNNGPYMSMEEQEQQYFQPSYQAPIYEEAKTSVAKNSLIKEWIANGALIILSIALVVSLIALISELRFMNTTYTRDADDFWYTIEYGNYSDLVTMKADNEAKGVHKTSELKQCYAVADYFEAASLYKAAVYKGDTEAMKQYLLRMEEAYVLFDDISYVAEEIDENLGIEIAR